MPDDDRQPGKRESEPPRIRLQDDGNVLIIDFPRRRIDGVGVRELFETAAPYFSQRQQRMIIDLTDVPTVSSGVMGILVTIQKRFRQADNQLHLIVPNPLVHEQFELMNMQLMLRLFNTAEDALAAFE